LLGELRIGNFGHGFLLNAERNPPAYRTRQHGQIERLHRSKGQRTPSVAFVWRSVAFADAGRAAQNVATPKRREIRGRAPQAHCFRSWPCSRQLSAV
jgi:hypothetical protein